MKKTILTFIACIVLSNVFATVITITTSSFTFSPASVTAMVGDTVTIAGSSLHPLVQVDQTVWNANGATPLAGGWGTKTADYTFTITSASDIYFVCGNHHSMGMKGSITVLATGIPNVSPVKNWSLYPNPSLDGKVYVSSSGSGLEGGSLFIYDTKGKLVQKINSTENKIALNLPQGVYLYRVYNQEEYSAPERLIITR